jgi:hypothetical protein
MKLITIKDYTRPSISSDFKSLYSVCLFAFNF